MHVGTLLLLAPLALTLAACADDDDHDFAAVAAARDAAFAADPPLQVVFDPAAGLLPFPNDVLFAGSEDGTLNIPVDDPADLSDPSVALNLMDGFSTTAAITTGLSADPDPASLRIGETIRMFELERDADGRPTALGPELGAEEITVDARDRTLALLPVVPLRPATDYAVYVTDGVTGLDGQPLGTPIRFALTRGATPLGPGSPAAAANPELAGLEPLRLATRPLIELVAADATPLAPEDIALAWSFRTEGIREVLGAASALAAPGQMIVAPSGRTTADLPDAGLPGKADIYVGALQLPYYQVPLDAEHDARAAINGYWVDANGAAVTRYSPTPVPRATENVPVLMTVPNATSAAGAAAPAGGWPIMIFQHGINRDRTVMLPVADAMADAGFVVVAIDMPMHGITDPENPFHANANPFADGERTFGIDVLGIAADGTRTPGPDGVPDPTGAHFYNLANLVNARDNLRQAVVDLRALSESVGAVLLATGADTPPEPFPIDVTRKAFLGHSLGGTVGVTFLSYDDSVTAASLAMPGGGIAQLLASSATFGPAIRAGVAAASGGELDAAEYQRFLVAAQTVVDSGDPINHAATLAAAAATSVHLMEVVGTPGTAYASDRVIPNAVFGAPLAGTEPLARLLGLEPVVASTSGGALVRFARGSHGSIINPVDAADPAGALATTLEMQREVATFAASGGQTLAITDAAVIAPLDVVITPAGAPDEGPGTAGPGTEAPADDDASASGR